MCKSNEGYIFISYAHKDSETVIPIIRGLEKRGFNVWYDSGIEAGTEWPEYIAEKLLNCSVVLAFISQHAVDSKNCRREINFSIDQNKDMLAVYIKEDLQLTPGMKLQLMTLQGIFMDRFSDEDAFIDALSAAEFLKKLKGEENDADSHTVKVNAVISQKTYPDGNVYEGEFVDGVPEGKGKMTFANGDVYEGSFSGGKANGFGKAYFANGAYYEGTFSNGKISGKGKYKFAGGEVYEGEYVAGKRNGKGKMIFTNGDVYDGDFLADKRTGKARMFYGSGFVYDGYFLDGKCHGKGKMICDNGNIYEGEFKDDRYEGKGKMTFTSGDVYEGEFFDSKRSGKGRYTFATGEVQEGIWENDILKSGYEYNKSGKKTAKIIDGKKKKLGLFGF